MSKGYTERSVMLSDMNGMLMAEFMIMEYPNDSSKWVKCIPFYGMYQLNISDPINTVSAGMLMPDTSFLGYIATVAANSDKYPAPFSMYPSGVGDYIHLDLKPGLSAKDISTLTRFDREMVNAYYKTFFIIKTVNNEIDWTGWNI